MSFKKKSVLSIYFYFTVDLVLQLSELCPSSDILK
jgi:hypothetical protein